MNQPLSALWVGPRLSRLEWLCLSSAVRVGHEVNLFTYERLGEVPDGVTQLDANRILPRTLMIQYKYNGSYALGSDLFRYKLLSCGFGCWIDTDVFFLQKIEDASYIFGWEDEGSMNSAVLYVDPQAPLLKALLEFASSDPTVPPWWSEAEQQRQRERPRPVDQLPWGTIGPKALTYYATKLGLTHWAQSHEVFYPIHWKQARSVLDPAADTLGSLTPRTRTIHLCNHIIADKKDAPDPHSLLANLYATHLTSGR
jgi:hypothetical protein